MPLRVVSYGGGVQSTALLVLAATGRIDFRTFLFANVGNDSEDPLTLAYIEQHAAPYAEAHGIELHQLDRVPTKGRSRGEVETLYGRLTRDGSRSLPIPLRMSNGAPGTRSCTADFKIAVIGRWLRSHGASATNPATVGVGISLDEIERVNNRRDEPYERTVYPLLDHDPPLRRSDCARVIRGAGLPVPPKSSCWFCPFHRPSTWAEMRRDRPDLFARACGLEDLLNKRRSTLGKDPVYLTRFNRSLAEAIPAAQDMLPLLDQPEDDVTQCDNGACFV
jgi:hypothetical protein